MSSLKIGERVARSAWRVTPQRALSEVIGWGARLELPSSVRASFLRSFAGRYGIDLDEAEKPLEQYGGVQDLFTRKLKPGARPVDGAADAVVAPADGTLVEIGRVSSGAIIHAKGGGFTLRGLLADEDAARALEGGPYAIIYLSPKDYHRVHAPVAGSVRAWHYVPGKLFPVNDRSLAREPDLFGKNERFVTLIDGAAGPAAIVMVAAVGVGHITASYDPDVATHERGFSNGAVRSKRFSPPVSLDRGQEVGVFNLGSTVIIVFAAGWVRFDDLAPGSPTRVGRALGRVVGSGLDPAERPATGRSAGTGA
jgi:phosphatidylserine decarboxylase